MSESKKGIHQITRYSYLFFNSPEIYYTISFEIVDTSKIRIILLKILEAETYIFNALVPFEKFGTGDKSAQDTINKVVFIIYNYNFIIKEDLNKVYLYLNSKIPSNIELTLFEHYGNEQNDQNYNEEINKMQTIIQSLLSTISRQEQKINELKKVEEMNINKIQKMEQVTKNLFDEINNKQNKSNNNRNNNNNQYNNYENPNSAQNPYRTNIDNQYNNNNNNTFYPGHNRIITFQTQNPYNPKILSNPNNYPNIGSNDNVAFNPYK